MSDDDDQDLGDFLDVVELIPGVNCLVTLGASWSWRAFLKRDLAPPETLERLMEMLRDV